MKRSVRTAVLLLLLVAAVCSPVTHAAASAGPDGSTGGDDNALVIDVTGGTLTHIGSQGETLMPAFSPADTDYVWACTKETGNTIKVNMIGEAPITVGSDTATHLSVAVTVVPNQAVVINAPGSLQYWIRCLPPSFPKMTITSDGSASAGYYVTGTFSSPGHPGYPMILNGYGTPVWYADSGVSAQDTEVLPGTETVAWGESHNSVYDLLDLSTDTLSTLTTPVKPFDAHELYTDTSGNRWMISVPIKGGYDLSSIGYPGVTHVEGCVVQELDPAGNLIWEWDATQWVSPDEDNGLESAHKIGGVEALDAYHCNSVDVDPLDPDYVLVSMRHVGVFLIDKATGEPIWKLGGTDAPTMSGEPQLTIVDDPDGNVRGQHDARFQPDGDISMFDDETGNSMAARAVQYTIDAASETATMDWEYAEPSGKNSASMGSVRRYDSNLNTYDRAGTAYQGPQETLIDWGHGAPSPGFTELGPSGAVELDVVFHGADGNRAEKVPLSTFPLNTLRDLAGTAVPSS